MSHLNSDTKTIINLSLRFENGGVHELLLFKGSDNAYKVA